MTAQYWTLFVLGGVVSGGATIAFLYSLARGLRGRGWELAVLVAAVWLAAMVAIAGWDSEQRREEMRRRAQDLAPQAPGP